MCAPRSSIALQRDNVRAAGAAAMLYYYTTIPMPNYPDPQPGVSIPVLFISQGVGELIKGLLIDQPDPANVSVSLSSPVEYFDVVTRNLIVDTFAGDGDNVIVVGGHADSVPAGPGINDDGSGSASNFEIMLAYYKLYSSDSSAIKNRVRFVFFGAEEVGLLGSFAYVEALNATNDATHSLDKVVVALDHDMFGECGRLLWLQS